MGCGASSEESFHSEDSGSRNKYVNGQPTETADEIYSCFVMEGREGKRSGGLYRLINTKTKMWYFYNDTKDCNCVVTGYFGPKNAIRALGTTQMWREEPSGIVVLEVIVRPLTTAPYLQGNANHGFDVRYTALPT